MSAGAGRAAGRPLPPASVPSRPPGPWFQRPGVLRVGTLPSAGLAARGSGVPGSQPGEGSRPRSMTTQGVRTRTLPLCTPPPRYFYGWRVPEPVAFWALTSVISWSPRPSREKESSPPPLRRWENGLREVEGSATVTGAVGPRSQLRAPRLPRHPRPHPRPRSRRPWGATAAAE